MKAKKPRAKKSSAKRKVDPAWRDQLAVARLEDERRASLRARLRRFDDATLARMRALFARLVSVTALEIATDDATIDALAGAHDLFFPALSVLSPPKRSDRIAVALVPIAAACAEIARGGEARELARYARWQLGRQVDLGFDALDLDDLAAGIARATAKRARKGSRPAPRPTAEALLVEWNAKAGYPLGKLTADAVTKARQKSERRRRGG